MTQVHSTSFTGICVADNILLLMAGKPLTLLVLEPQVLLMSPSTQNAPPCPGRISAQD